MPVFSIISESEIDAGHGANKRILISCGAIPINAFLVAVSYKVLRVTPKTYTIEI